MTDFEYYGPGRPPLPETVARMKRMITLIRKEPDIPSAKLARVLGIPSLECATLARRLAKRGVIVINRANRALTYTLANDA